MKKLIDTLCKHQTQCFGCRNDLGFQNKLKDYFEVPPYWPSCPFGKKKDVKNKVAQKKKKRKCGGCGGKKK